MKTQLIGVDRWINQQTGEIIEAQTIAREVKEVDIGFEKLWIGHILEAIEEVGNAKVKVLFGCLGTRMQTTWSRQPLTKFLKLRK